MMNLIIIDSLSPFFTPLKKGVEYNWSKVNFTALEKDGVLNQEYADRILHSFDSYIKKVKSIGYNSITIDELCRMIYFDFYNNDLIEKIKSYRSFYKRLFRMIKEAEMNIYVTTDIMFYNQDIHNFLKGKKKNKATTILLKIAIDKLFKDYKEVDGVICRLGESDGLDVEGDFLSNLFIKNPKQCRKLIKSILPIFEDREKNMIIRSWTLGAYSIGDLMWNKDTMNKVFRNIESDNLIISHKYGESDFFRYLNLNPLFYDCHLQQIVELQSRREYESFGEFPCYIGTDYERIKRYLDNTDNIVGLSTWCQTGGWSHFTKLTFTEDSSLWTEINTYIIPKIFKENYSAKDAVHRYATYHMKEEDGPTLYKLLKLSEKVFKELWYIPEISSKRLYFRRSRVPTLMWIVWDNIIISHMLRAVLRPLVLEKREAIIDGYRALKKIKKIAKLAAKLKIDQEQFSYMYDTFKIIASGREYYLGRRNLDLERRILKLSDEYNKKYPDGFHIINDFSAAGAGAKAIRQIFKLAIRTEPQYTLFDKVILLRFSSLIYKLLKRKNRNKDSDNLMNNQAMGFEIFLK